MSSADSTCTPRKNKPRQFCRARPKQSTSQARWGVAATQALEAIVLSSYLVFILSCTVTQPVIECTSCLPVGANPKGRLPHAGRNQSSRERAPSLRVSADHVLRTCARVKVGGIVPLRDQYAYGLYCTPRLLSILISPTFGTTSEHSSTAKANLDPCPESH